MPLSPTATRDLLAQLGHQPKRFLGQNFLVDGNIVRKSLELAEIQPGDAVVEIGPGLGTLTSALIEAGAEVWAVERDRNLHQHLEEVVVPASQGRLHLLEGDGVEHPLAALPDERAQAGFKVVANLPYAISSPWMEAVLAGVLPVRMVLMLQQEAAQRYAAKPGGKQFSAISIFLQSAFDLAPGHKVAAACFFPKPDIESYLLHLVRKPQPFIFRAEVRTLIRACFQQRRKQIGSLVRDKLPGGGTAWFLELRAAGLNEQARPEDIPVALWERFAAHIPATA